MKKVLFRSLKIYHSYFSDFIYFPGQTASNEIVSTNNKDDIEACGQTKEAPNIATSVLLSFSTSRLNETVVNRMKRNWWKIEQTIIVHKTVPSTFFGVIHIPGIYAGLQQLPDNDCKKRKSKN